MMDRTIPIVDGDTQAPPNFLVVEDSPSDFLLIEREFTKASIHHHSLRVDSRQDLEKALEGHSWALVLSDYNVPGMSFEDNLPLFRKLCPDTPILLVSGNVGEEKAVELLKRGVWDFVLKENLTRLVPSVERCLREADDRAARRAAEEELRRSEERLRLALTASKTGVWEWNIHSHETFWSEECLKIANMQTSTPVLRDFMKLLHPDDAPWVKREIAHCLAARKTFSAEFRIISSTGETRWVSNLGQPHYNGSNRPIRMVGTVQDITERRESEAQLRRSAAVFTNTQEGVTITDIEGTILAVNPAVCSITGYDEQELIGSNMRVVRSGRHDKAFYRRIFETIAVDGFWQGEMWNRRKNGEIFPAWLTISSVRDEGGRTFNYVGTFTDISRIKQSERQLEHLAHHDPLTDLPNRLLLRSRLDHAIDRTTRDGGQGALLFLDLDRFKNVNDSLGHPAGDLLLQMVAERLLSRLRETDTLARLGGDEFAVLIEDLPSPQEAASVAQSLIEEMKRPFLLLDGHKLYVGTSIGISIFPDDGNASDPIIRNADAALYQAKGGGRATFRFYTEALTIAANARVKLETQLRRGIEQQEFVLHFQPLISMAESRITGVEALVRWRSPAEGELVPPARFIPLAEETGLIVPLGDWVLRTACRQMMRWLKEDNRLTCMAVNLSSVQFRQPDVAERVESALEESGLPAHFLELEITESGLMEFGPEAEAKLDALKMLGVRLAIDDFGTGYSSLAYLRRFPIDKLKVDQSFVRDIPADSAAIEIAAAVVALGKTLHLEVLAEGVETKAQCDLLQRLGCNTAQGYLFDRPLSAIDLTDKWLR
ncbi:EAL domain-containing protein [Telmatospirillum siberiense]|uniref:GGDEF domain-containing protein n=1 Tax=Telmatospirillum siberiense TaxID=382514 RepID=A0A2N3PYK7_9PROT|nr:EAL domain-containing protein [Telmatospirillum siberiense]PKU25483.1 GGDEF domain-containing protein [Telmatospirillum siberiense]